MYYLKLRQNLQGEKITSTLYILLYFFFIKCQYFQSFNFYFTLLFCFLYTFLYSDFSIFSIYIFSLLYYFFIFNFYLIRSLFFGLYSIPYFIGLNLCICLQNIIFVILSNSFVSKTNVGYNCFGTFNSWVLPLSL